MKTFRDKQVSYRGTAARLVLCFFLLAILALGGLDPGPARAQEAEPEERPPRPASGDPIPLQPGPYVSPEIMERLAQPPGEKRRPVEKIPAAGIESGLLESIDPAAIGVLNPETGGFPVDLWRGTNRELLEQLWSRLPAADPSPALNELAAKLLLSAGPVPEPVGNQASNALLGARLDAIVRLGRLEPLISYILLLPEADLDLDLRRTIADAYLMDSDLVAACEIAELGRAGSGAAYWLRLEALCMAVNGNAAMARQNIDLLAESGELTPPFAEWIEAVLLKRSGLETETPAEEPEAYRLEGPEVDPVLVALGRAAGLAIDIIAPESLPLLIQAHLAKSGAMGLDLRAELGEQAARRGALEPEILGEIFLGLEFTAGERGSAEILAQTDLGARVDGLIYRQAVEAKDDSGRFERIALGWRRARRMEMLPALGPLYANLVKNITPRPALIEYAPLAGRILLYAGQRAAADAWAEMLLSQVVLGGSASGLALAEMWPLHFVSGSDLAADFSPETLELWRQTAAALPVDEQLKRAGVLYGLLEALGQPVPQSAWHEVLAVSARDSAGAAGYAMWRQLILSANAGRLGETACLAILAAGAEGAGRAPLAVLTTVIAALRRVGLEREARALASERLVAAGF